MRSAVATFALAAGAVLWAAGTAAQDYLGPNKCINCHDHEDEAEWWRQQDGPPPDGHINALRQMESVDSPRYAAAVGLDESFDGVYDLDGSCVSCHATVFKGDANAGVSCENCHGPGSDYLDSHQEENSYQDSLARGMLDVVDNLRGWVEQCVRCHVMDDQRLIDAGHPSGDDFDVEEKFDVVALHWGQEYRAPEVASSAADVRRALIDARTEAPAPAPLAAPAPARPAPPAVPAPAPSTPPAVPAPSAAATPRAAPAVSRPAAPSPPPRTMPAPVPRPDRTEPVVISDTGATLVESPPELPRSPAALVAAVQGQAIRLLDRLLRRDGRAPIRVTPPTPPVDYRGADAELLRLQQEVLALALEALGTAPADGDARDANAEPTP